MSQSNHLRPKEKKAPVGAERRSEIQTSLSYRLMQATARVMDRYYLDPIVGFLLPGYGDVVTALLVAPFLYVSAVKVRSLPLTLAMLCNVLLDVLVGLLPFFVGTVLDFVSKSYTKNARLVEGFVAGEKEVISQVNRKALLLALMVVLLCLLIVGLVLLLIELAKLVGDAWSWLCGLF